MTKIEVWSEVKKSEDFKVFSGGKCDEPVLEAFEEMLKKQTHECRDANKLLYEYLSFRDGYNIAVRRMAKAVGVYW